MNDFTPSHHLEYLMLRASYTIGDHKRDLMELMDLIVCMDGAVPDKEQARILTTKMSSLAFEFQKVTDALLKSVEVVDRICQNGSYDPK